MTENEGNGNGNKNTNGNNDFDNNKLKTKLTIAIPIGILLTGLLMTLLYPFGTETVQEKPFTYLSYVSISVLLAGASLLLGGFLGFLFAIPRTLQEQGNEGNTADKQLSYNVNTNLEQISDWLTKILIGVGLTQISTIPSRLQNLSNFFAGILGEQSSIYAVILIIYFLVGGFLLGYLTTRLLFTNALAKADISVLLTLGQIEASIKESLSESKNQDEVDIEALNLLDMQFQFSSDRKEVNPQDLKIALLKASSMIKRQAFLRAQKIRRENWNNTENKYKISRTIPIFQALIEDKSRLIPHEYYAELAYAYKDKENPKNSDLVNSKKFLTKAIEQRGEWQPKIGSRIYEFNRAYCSIKLDQKFKRNEPTTSEDKEHIVKDLSIAVSRKKLRTIVAEDHMFQDWIRINEVTSDNLDVYAKVEIPQAELIEIIKPYPL